MLNISVTMKDLAEFFDIGMKFLSWEMWQTLKAKKHAI